MEITMETHQVLIKLLNGKHQILNFTTPFVPIENLKQRIQTLTLIPSYLQLLTLSDSRILHDSQSLNLSSGHSFNGQVDTRNSCYVRSPEKGNGKSFPVVVHLLLRLRGGKGGFGSLLRGAATKAGQKKTNNFDACRDMSGRRLRHVNAEKKLEEWRAEAEERKLEKMAQEFIKKKEKESGGKKAKRNDDAEKYVAKYREDSAKCMEEVERTVRESLKGVLSGKRKGAVVDRSDAEAKKMKIWLGKRKLADCESEDSDEDDSDDSDGDEENDKSVVINNGNHSDSSKEAEGSPDSITGARLDISGSEEEKDVVSEESTESGNTGDSCAFPAEAKSGSELVPEGSEEIAVQNEGECSLKAQVVSGSETFSQEKEVANVSDSDNNLQSVSQPPVISDSGMEEASSTKVDADPNSNLVQEETLSMSPQVADLEKPLNLEECNSAVELEVLGMERLKSELQARGLKCGGTLQERAARLFLLKTTPLEKLPKKLFAKK